jgi:hypothetical protein
MTALAFSSVNIWTRLLGGHDDVVNLAENVVAAAIGADADPTIFTGEVEKCAEYVFGGGDDEIGARTIRLAAAVAGISRGLTSSFGSFVVEVKEETGEAGPDDRRSAELHFLSIAAGSLRDTIAGE